MSRTQEVIAILGLVVGMLACIAAWLALPQVQRLADSLLIPTSTLFPTRMSQHPSDVPSPTNLLDETPISPASTPTFIPAHSPTDSVIPPSLTPVPPGTIPANTHTPHYTKTLIPPTPTPIPPTTVSINEESVIVQLTTGESEAFMQRDIGRLESMWSNDGVEIDAGFTSTTSDDKIWRGWPAIRERYLDEFNYSYSVENTNIRVVVTGDTATAFSDLIYDGTLYTDQDKWTFQKEGGQWTIISLTFNLAR